MSSLCIHVPCNSLCCLHYVAGDHKPGPVGKGAAGDEYKKPQLVVADGLLVMPGALQHWEKIMSFQARPDDTFIASYPKSGVCHFEDFFFC